MKFSDNIRRFSDNIGKLSDIHTHFPQNSLAELCAASPLTDVPFSLENQKAQAGHLSRSNVFSFGIHPWQAANMECTEKNCVSSLFELDTFFATRPQHVMMGEIGLDACRERLEQQKIIFRAQLEIAIRNHCHAVIIHCVRALHLLPAEFSMLRRRSQDMILILHGFCGSIQDVRSLFRFDVYFSFSYKHLMSSKRTAEAAIAVPENRLLTETDMDTPDTLPKAVSLLAACRQETPEQCAATVFENTCRIFETL